MKLNVSFITQKLETGTHWGGDLAGSSFLYFNFLIKEVAFLWVRSILPKTISSA
jgi:hypothetical protein